MAFQHCDGNRAPLGFSLATSVNPDCWSADTAIVRSEARTAAAAAGGLYHSATEMALSVTLGSLDRGPMANRETGRDGELTPHRGCDCGSHPDAGVSSSRALLKPCPTLPLIAGAKAGPDSEGATAAASRLRRQRKTPPILRSAASIMSVRSFQANETVVLVRRRERSWPPIRPKPRIIMPQVAGSGTAAASESISNASIDEVNTAEVIVLTPFVS